MRLYWDWADWSWQHYAFVRYGRTHHCFDVGPLTICFAKE